MSLWEPEHETVSNLVETGPLPAVRPGAVLAGGSPPRQTLPGEAVDTAAPAPVPAALEPPVAPNPQRPPNVGELIRRRWSADREGRLIAALDLLAFLAVLVGFGAVPAFDAAAVVLLLGVLLLANCYRSPITLSVLDHLPRLVACWVAAIGVTAAGWLAITRSVPSPRERVFVAALLVGLVLARLVSYAVVRRLRRSGRFARRTIILGGGEVANTLGRAMVSDGSYGCQLVGTIDSDPPHPGRQIDAPLLGTTEHAAAILAEHQAQRLVVAFTLLPESDLVPLMQASDRADVEIYAVPRLFEMTASRDQGDEIDGVPLHRLHRAPYRAPTWMLKRALDVVVAGSALVVLSPLLAVLAVVNRLVDGPGIIFKQVRIGIDGREFEVLKFRSMRPVDDTESATNWNIKNDDRVSWFGKVLRRSSLDELPQLWNIVRGDMSLVGPRPERPHFVAEFGDRYVRYDARHRVPCGLTGWAQIHGLRGDTSIAERVRYDNYYIQNWSLWLDIKIILRTLTAFMKGSG